MIFRQVSWPRLIHIRPQLPHKVRPTSHCARSRSDTSYKILIYIKKETWLFFDQVNNYANFRCGDRLRRLASTDLSTVIVDNLNGTVMTQGLTFQLAEPSCPRAQVRISFAAPFLALIFTIWPEERVLRRGDRSCRARRFCRNRFTRFLYESRYPPRIQTNHGHLYLREQVRDSLDHRS